MREEHAKSKISVLLADDHTLLREMLRRLLQDCSDMHVVGEAKDGHEAVRLAREHKPDVIVMDLAMPALDGIDATKQILSDELPCKILMLTMHANEEYAVRALQAGAYGILGKGGAGRDVIEAIRKVSAGERYLPLSLREGILERYARGGSSESPLASLTDREVQILKRLAEGATNQLIAQDLHLSPKTVETYRARLLSKLELNTTSDLIRFALRYGIIADLW